DNFKQLREHPISIWIELQLGLIKEEGRWVRAKPQALTSAARKLAEESGVNETESEDYLREFLLNAYQCKDVHGKSLFAFRLHQFISGASNVYSTLEPENERAFDLSGQIFVPGKDKKQKYFSLHFCRHCGQEY